jgi:hypothetical protein
LGLGVENVIKNALLRRSLDNVTSVVIAFEGFSRLLNNKGFYENPAKDTIENS